jgi:tryptophan-rich sensory protein
MQTSRSAPAKPAGPLGNAAALAVSLALVFAIAGIGGWVTAGSVDGWYRTLAKPSFNPPAWIFGPVWTALYVLMAVAAWRVWRQFGSVRHPALLLYALQLALNLAWSILFFGLHRPGWALADLLSLLAAVIATMILFGRIDRWAGLCFVPYAMWVAFAGLLNAMIWRLN